MYYGIECNLEKFKEQTLRKCFAADILLWTKCPKTPDNTHLNPSDV